MKTPTDQPTSNHSLEISRKFKPTFLVLRRRISIFILTALLSLYGLFSYNDMPRELFPEIVIPIIFIQTVYPGNSPVDIENLITRPIEKELKGLKGVKTISSASYQDISLIAVEFQTDVEVKQALQDTKDRVDKAKRELPEDLDEDPQVEDIDLDEFPIMNINLSGDYPLVELKHYAEIMEDEFEALDEISEADIKGIDEREIQINVDPHRAEAHQVTFQDIEDAVRLENITMGAGEFISDNVRRTIRTDADYSNMDQIRHTIVKSDHGKIVYLRDIAEVVDGYEERTSISRFNNVPVVSLTLTKKSGANILEASDKVRESIVLLREKGYIPPSLDVIITNDNSKYVRDEISNLENSILMGMVFVMVTLYLFLGPRNALFSGLAIPMSMFISFIILKAAGFTLNNMILFSLILALGMLVDNAIVVVENVYRLFSKGLTPMDATKGGVSEIAYPIISSTATTLAAFFPLIFWEGIVGEFMKYLPLTLIIVLSSSLFVALILNPVFTSTFMKKEYIFEKGQPIKMWKFLGLWVLIAAPFYLLGWFIVANICITLGLFHPFNFYLLRPAARWFQGRLIPGMENIYEHTLGFALAGKRPLLFFGGTIVLLFLSTMFFLSTRPKIYFFPDSDPQNVYVILELPNGTDLAQTDSISREMEGIIEKTLNPYNDIVKSTVTIIGSGKGGLFESARDPHKALATISFVEFQDRHGISTSKIMRELTHNLSDFVGAKITVEKEENGPPVGNPINLEISGDDFDELLRISFDIKNQIEESAIPGINQLKLDLNTDKPEMRVKVNRDRARRFGLSTQEVAYTLRSSIYGREVGKFKDGEEEYDIMLRLAPIYRNDVSTLMNQKIISNGNGDSRMIPISSVASFDYSVTYDKINRIDNTRVITIYSNIQEGFNANEINNSIRNLLSDYQLPPGYTLSFTGEQEEQAKTSAFLMRALLIAVSIILLILVSQFNSLFQPLIIITTVVLSTIGVFLGYGIFKMDFVILMTGVGIISLAGIVVNNSIVLVDYINLLRHRYAIEENLHEEALLPRKEMEAVIIQAGKTRLRPVLLTATTTVLGLIPLAIGLNFDFAGLYREFDPHIFIGGESTAFWGPMAWTVIYGLIFATFLTLIITPVMYLMASRVQVVVQLVKDKFGKGYKE